MQQTALALENEARANGRYSKDCNRVNDAIVRGQKSGVALLWDAAGKLEVVDLNGGSKLCDVTETGANGVTVEHNFATWNNPGRSKQHRDETKRIVEEGEESYEQLHHENFKKAAARSHERENETSGKFEPQSHEGRNPVGDATRMARELKAKQDRNSARERSYRADAIERNEAIAATQKAFWKKSA